MDLHFKTNNTFVFTPVSNIFIDEYIKGSNPAFVSVYIVSLRYFYSLGNVDTKLISEISGLLESDVIKAFEYWSEKGIISLEREENDVITVEFFDLEAMRIKKEAEKQAAIAFESELEKRKSGKNISQKIQYTNTEINTIMKKNPEISFILKLAEKSFAKCLTGNDRNTLVSLYDWLQMPIEVIAVLITYCSENNKNIRYLEKVAIDWSEKGIDTEEKAVEYLNMFNNEYRDIFIAFGIKNREPVEEEQNYMKKWLKVFKMPMEIIREACTRTIIKTGKSSFEYADGILKNWFEKNIQSLEDVKKADEEFIKNKKTNNSNAQQSLFNNFNNKNNKSRFVNYEQRTFDPVKMRELEKKIVESDLKKLEENR